MDATLHTSGVSNMDKLEFDLIRLNDPQQPTMVVAEVSRFRTRAQTNPPPG